MQYIYEETRIVLLDEKTKNVMGLVTFEKMGEGLIEVLHTEVNAAYRGLGLAQQLMYAVVDLAEERRVKLHLSCSYAVKWFFAHREYQHLVDDFMCWS